MIVIIDFLLKLLVSLIILLAFLTIVLVFPSCLLNMLHPKWAKKMEDRHYLCWLVKKFKIFPYSSPTVVYVSSFMVMLIVAGLLLNSLLSCFGGVVYLIGLIGSIILYVLVINIGMWRRAVFEEKKNESYKELYKNLLIQHAEFAKIVLMPTSAISFIIAVVGILTENIKLGETNSFLRLIESHNECIAAIILLLIIIAIEYLLNKIFLYIYEYVYCSVKSK